jgi:hypothetical protein
MRFGLLLLLRLLSTWSSWHLIVIAVPTGTLVCIVALLATSVARHVLILLHKILLLRLSFIFIRPMSSLVVHVVWQHCHSPLYRLWVVSTFHTFWYPLLQKNAGYKLVSWRFLIRFIRCCRRWHWGPRLGFSHINTWCKAFVVFSSWLVVLLSCWWHHYLLLSDCGGSPLCCSSCPGCIVPSQSQISFLCAHPVFSYFFIMDGNFASSLPGITDSLGSFSFWFFTNTSYFFTILSSDILGYRLCRSGEPFHPDLEFHIGKRCYQALQCFVANYSSRFCCPYRHLSCMIH